MIGNNRHYFGPLYAKAGNLFERLTDFKKLWLPWVGLGYVDVDELCSIHLQTANDWERNFRKCKHFSQKIAKIQKYNYRHSLYSLIIKNLNFYFHL